MAKTKIDISRKEMTAIRCDERHEIFAPSWNLLMSYKNGDLTWEEYVDCYKNEMRDAYKKDKTPFVEMAKRLDEVEFICFCNLKKKQDSLCHRFILREILETVKEQL